MKSVNATVLGNLVSAHYEHDEESLRHMCSLLLMHTKNEAKNGRLKSYANEWMVRIN